MPKTRIQPTLAGQLVSHLSATSDQHQALAHAALFCQLVKVTHVLLVNVSVCNNR